MIYKINFISNAEEDLKNILDYISLHLSNKKASNDFYHKLMSKLEYLIDNPFIYEEINDPNLKLRGYRKIVIDNYILLYSINEDTVNIARIFYGKQNYVNIL